MTIDELYRFVQFLANKDQRGFIKPSEFNLAATRAQLDIIEEKFKSENTHKNLDDLAPVIDKATITHTNGAFSFPTRFLHFVSMTFDSSTVELIGHEKLQNRLSSALVAPTTSYPVAVMIDTGFEIFTSSSEATSGTCVITYVKEPLAPKWTSTVVNGAPVYNSSAADAQELTLPTSTRKDILHKVLEYVGVSLREQDITAFGSSFNESSKE
tara:strand:+ start:2404 stop:3039 length:636 start_codon:yes stop_codon:yes gene_type:complete